MSRLLQVWRLARARVAPRPRLPVRPLQLPELVGGVGASQQIAVGESLDWLNSMFAGLWPKVNAAAQKIVHEQVTQQLQSQMPALLRNVHFSEFSLGTVPPALGPVKVYEVPSGMKMTLAIDYQSDVDIRLQVGPVGLGVKALRFSGELVLRLEQLLDQVPVVGGLVLYFLNPPRIEYTFTGLGMAAEFPGLSGAIRRAVDQAVSSGVVLPNQLAVPLGTEAQGVDRAELMLAKPLGLLRVTAVSAAGLQGPDWEEAGKEAASAYVVVKTADERWESSAAEAEGDPAWPEGDAGDLFVYDHEQRLWASVFDHDSSESSDFIGASKDISLVDALANEGPLTLYSREHVGFADEEEAVTCGELTLGFQFLEFVPGELCGDKYVLCVKVDTISMPADCGGHAQLRVALAGSSPKATPVGKEATEHEGSIVVSDLLCDVIRRSSAKGLSAEDIAEITALEADEVAAVLEGGEVPEEAVVAKTRRLIRVDACLFLPFSPELLDSESLELTVADRRGQEIASTHVPLLDLTEAEDLTVSDLHAMETETGGEVNAHVSLILMGTRESHALE